MQVTKKIFTRAAAKKMSPIFYCLKRKKTLIRTNKFASINFFVCVFF